MTENENGLGVQHVRTACVAVSAFVLGIAAARIPLSAHASTMPLSPALIDLASITPDAMPTPTTAFPNLRSKTLIATDALTAGLTVGTLPKHFHAGSTEIQIVLEGTGTEWLGDHAVTLKPETMVIVPSGTNHGGFVETSGHFKFISIKTPPQDPSDYHLVP